MRSLLMALLSLSIVGCASGASPGEAPAPLASPLLRAEDAIAATALAFGRDGDAHVAGGPGWRVAITSDELRIASGAPERGAALRATIARAGWQCAPAPGAPVIRADGALERPMCPGVVDRVETRREGIAWSWALERAPAGSGDLELMLEVRGADVERAQDGTRLVPTSGAPSLIVSDATWIDSAGTRVDIPLRARGRTLVAIVPAEVVAGARFPAVLDPTIGPEVRVDEPLEHHLAEGTDLRLASNGTHFLAVWEGGSFAGGMDVRAARLDASGVPVEPFGFPIDETPGNQTEPSVVWTGTRFVVSYRAGMQHVARRVAADGTVIDAVPIVLTPSVTTWPVGGDLVMVGSTLFFVWRDGNSVLARRYDPTTLAPLDAAAILVVSGSSTTLTSAAGGGTRLLVTWMSGSRPVVRGRVLSESGALEGTADIAISGTEYAVEAEAAVVWDGSAFDVLYYSFLGPMHLVRIDPSGTVLDPTPIALAASCDSMVRIGAAWDGSRLWALAPRRVSSGYYDTAILSVDPRAAAPVSSTPVLMGGGPRTGNVAAVAYGGGTLEAVWSDRSQTLWATRIDADGAALDVPNHTLSRTSNQQAGPDLAWNGSSYLVAWRDLRVVGSGVYAVRVSRDGTALDPIGRLIGGDGTEDPEVVAVGSSWVVLWPELDPALAGRTLRARAVGPDGVPLGSPVTLPFGLTARAASDGTTLRFAYNQASVAYTQALGLDLAPLGDPVVADDYGGVVSFVWVGTGWALVTTGESGSSSSRAWLVVLAPSGAPLAPPIDVSPTARNVRDAAVARDPEGMLVTWIDRATYPDVPSAARYAPDGTVLMAPRPIAFTGFTTAVHPVFDGVQYLLSPQPGGLVPFPPRGAFLGRDAAYLPGSPFDLATSPQQTYRVEVEGAGAGWSAFAWSAVAPEVPYRAARVRLRFAHGGIPIGAACTDASACDGGHCVDGVCCDSACGGAADDCAVCSAALGASADGTCTLLGSAVTCRPASGACDAPEVCARAEACPPDLAEVDGTPCDEGLVCNGTDTCSAGACTAAPAPDCDLGDVCSAYTCDEPTGCVATPIAGCCRSDADCADVSACTIDVCATGDGTCSHAPIGGCCELDGECADDDPCTDDRCAANRCEHAPSALCVDAGLDAGALDAGAPDSGLDAAPPPVPDAGADGGLPAPVDVGCGCRTHHSADAPWWASVALAIALCTRARRRSPSRRVTRRARARTVG